MRRGSSTFTTEVRSLLTWGVWDGNLDFLGVTADWDRQTDRQRGKWGVPSHLTQGPRRPRGRVCYLSGRRAEPRTSRPMLSDRPDPYSSVGGRSTKDSVPLQGRSPGRVLHSGSCPCAPTPPFPGVPVPPESSDGVFIIDTLTDFPVVIGMIVHLMCSGRDHRKVSSRKERPKSGFM